MRALLTPLSWLYQAGWQTYVAMYSKGVKRSKSPHSPTVVIGNLMVGGTGKSPTVLHVAELLLASGHEVVIGCSGYGSPRAEAAALTPDGDLDPAEWGDEPAMIRWLLPGVPLVVGRRRVLAAELVRRSHPNAVLLMDDGFQHLPLRHQVGIVLDDPNPQNHACLPAGPYREPRSNLARADLVIWTKPTNSGFWLERRPLNLQTPDGTTTDLPERVNVLCALGNPAGFLEAISGKAEVADARLLPDHDRLASGTLFEPLPEGLPIVVTAKDWVKLRTRKDLDGRRFLIATQEVRIQPEEQFKGWLAEKLNESKIEQGT